MGRACYLSLMLASTHITARILPQHLLSLEYKDFKTLTEVEWMFAFGLYEVRVTESQIAGLTPSRVRSLALHHPPVDLARKTGKRPFVSSTRFSPAIPMTIADYAYKHFHTSCKEDCIRMLNASRCLQRMRIAKSHLA